MNKRKIILHSEKNNYAMYLNNGSIGFGKSNASERLRINSDGYIGISTTAPSHKLEVMSSGYSANYT